MPSDSTRSAFARLDRSSDRDILQRALARWYERLGANMVLASLVVSVVFGTLTNVVMCAWAVRYLRFTISDFLLLVGVGLCVTWVVGAPLFWGLRGVIGRVLSWSGEYRTSERAPEV